MFYLETIFSRLISALALQSYNPEKVLTLFLKKKKSPHSVHHNQQAGSSGSKWKIWLQITTKKSYATILLGNKLENPIPSIRPMQPKMNRT